MGRWEPDGRGRLEQAALALYSERGFEQTTVAEIADRAGLTERTFFRHFTDKREVLFGGSDALQELMVDTAAAAPESAAPMAVAAEALRAAGALIQQRPDWARKRQAVIVANTELRERELIKLASLAEALAAVLRDRGVPENRAALAAETGVAVFRIAFERWVADADGRDLPGQIGAAFEELRSLNAPASN